MPPAHQQDALAEFATRLEAARVPAMLVGATAGLFYGLNRSSADIDFVVDLAPADVPRFVAAFGGGFYCDEAMIRDAIAHRSSFNIISHQTGIKADFILLGDSPFERAAFERRVADTWHGIPVWVTTGEDLVVSKLRWAKLGGSERQLADVRAILAAGHVTDFTYITRWVDALDLHEQLDASRATRYDA